MRNVQAILDCAQYLISKQIWWLHPIVYTDIGPVGLWVWWYFIELHCNMTSYLTSRSNCMLLLYLIYDTVHLHTRISTDTKLRLWINKLKNICLHWIDYDIFCSFCEVQFHFVVFSQTVFAIYQPTKIGFYHNKVKSIPSLSWAWPSSAPACLIYLWLRNSVNFNFQFVFAVWLSRPWLSPCSAQLVIILQHPK